MSDKISMTKKELDEFNEILNEIISAHSTHNLQET